MLRFVIYCHTNRVTGKAYVGQTRLTMESRWTAHVKLSRARSDYRQRRGCKAIAAAIKKHGVDAFDHEVLDVVTTQAGANRAERAWIARRGTRAPHGYNLSDGGDLVGSLSPNQRSERSRKGWATRWASMTAEEREARVVALAAGRAPETRGDVFRAMWASMTPVQRSETMRARALSVPSEIRSVRAKAKWDALPIETRERISRELPQKAQDAAAKLTHEQRSERARATAAAHPGLWSAAAKKRMSAMTPEQREDFKEKVRAGTMRLTPEQRSARASAGWTNLTPEQREARVQRTKVAQAAARAKRVGAVDA